MECKKCKSENRVKAGRINGEQRYKCKDCGCLYVPSRQRGRSEKDKLTAVWLYSHGLSFRAIAKFFKVSHKAVYDWVKAYAICNYVKPEPEGEAVVIELDEMWHYLHSKKTKSGYGRLIAVIPVNLSTGSADGEIMIHFQDFMAD